MYFVHELIHSGTHASWLYRFKVQVPTFWFRVKKAPAGTRAGVNSIGRYCCTTSGYKVATRGTRHGLVLSAPEKISGGVPLVRSNWLAS